MEGDIISIDIDNHQMNALVQMKMAARKRAAEHLSDNGLPGRYITDIS